MKRMLSFTIILVAVLGLCAGLTAAGDEGKWTGEVLDLSCYDDRGAKGTSHATCASTCLKNGKPMGLLTSDGDVVTLKAGEDSAPFESLKALAGKQAVVEGALAEEDGKKVVTVTRSKAAA